jgi:hypothetical protein
MRERHSRSAARHRNDPTQAAPILAEVYVLHVSIKVAGGPGRKATVRTSSCHLPSRLAGEPQVPDRRHPPSRRPKRLDAYRVVNTKSVSTTLDAARLGTAQHARMMRRPRKFQPHQCR